jgi:hypothetical protein
MTLFDGEIVYTAPDSPVTVSNQVSPAAAARR